MWVIIYLLLDCFSEVDIFFCKVFGGFCIKMLVDFECQKFFRKMYQQGDYSTVLLIWGYVRGNGGRSRQVSFRCSDGGYFDGVGGERG